MSPDTVRTVTEIGVLVVAALVLFGIVAVVPFEDRASPREPWQLRGTPVRHPVRVTLRTTLAQRLHEWRTAKRDRGLTPGEIPDRVRGLRW